MIREEISEAGVQKAEEYLQEYMVDSETVVRAMEMIRDRMSEENRARLNELLQGKEGTRIQDLSVRFEVPTPAEGDYAFIVRGRYAPGTERVEGQFPFTISTAESASGTPAATGSPASTPAVTTTR